MKLECTLFLLLTLFASSNAMATPVEDLASPDQAVRDRAATELRTTFKNTPESKWTPVLAKFQEGQSRDDVEKATLAIQAIFVSAIGMGEYSEDAYRLDDEWILKCRFVDGKLTRHGLERWPKGPFVMPPENFTGRWVLYYINGQKSGEWDYKNGRKDGECITYYCDGSKRCVEHYQDDLLQGDEMAFYPNGTIAHKGRWDRGKKVGTYTNYDKTGKITATKDHPKLPPENYTGKWTANYENGIKHIETDYKDGKRHGAHAAYFPSGKISCEGRYANDQETGTWKWFDKDGVVIGMIVHAEEFPTQNQTENELSH